jgi:CDP-diacylglycerol---glycerol-3-phosphate 3-phosphatidyltransferase
MSFNIANQLTLLRIVLIPVLVAVFYSGFPHANQLSAWIFLAAAITDWLDGYLARRLGLESRFGAFLDPVADKLMVAVVLILIVQADPKPWLAIVAAVIIGREISISALREWMAGVGERAKIKVGMLGKIKTVMQMAALSLLLYRAPLFGVIPCYRIGEICLWIAALLTLWSMAQYLMAARKALRIA